MRCSQMVLACSMSRIESCVTGISGGFSCSYYGINNSILYSVANFVSNANIDNIFHTYKIKLATLLTLFFFINVNR